MVLWEHLVTVYEETEVSCIAAICSFLDQISLPRLTVEQAEEMERELLAGELKEAARELACCKAPGPDGLQVEYYQSYVEMHIPGLQEALKETRGCKMLPQTM
ncbi:hypothetical protein NDU88_002280 [Pleurodeles waltl]|uniref:Uncharacterized protein n=1 Tax=Pleurodeles waltl TaxID=8319 RepID=A0AAV7NEZ4_PLEWA|nr:hypothetical protein NDU88_002280 [Pleurodeles waltl]